MTPPLLRFAVWLVGASLGVRRQYYARLLGSRSVYVRASMLMLLGIAAAGQNGGSAGW